MKSILSLLLLITVSCSCFSKELNDKLVIISGKIENPDTDSISFKSLYNKFIHSISVNNDGTFSDTLKFNEGYYILCYKYQNTIIYLRPGDSLFLSFNSEKLKTSIKFNGIGADENNYLTESSSLQISLNNLNSTKYQASLEEEVFLSLADSLYQLKLKLLNEYPKLGSRFIFYEQSLFRLNQSYMLACYESNKQYFSGNYEFKVSDKFPNPYNEINLDDERLLVFPLFEKFINRYLREKVIKKVRGSDVLDNELVYVKLLDSLIQNKKIKEEIVYRSAEKKLSRTTKLDDVYNSILPLVENEQYALEITELFNRIKKVSKGMPSPNFSLYDMNNNLVTLSDFKGKYLYIDIWGTWCTFCIKAMPAFIELEKKYQNKNIAFIGICIDSKKENWKEMVIEKNLTGHQLYAPTKNTDFFRDYMIYGAPRYILIDKEGKIIDNNAKGPSNSKIKDFFNNID